MEVSIIIRKIFAYLCCALEFVAMAVAGIFTYKAYKGEISFDLGLMLFIPVMIVSYWFSTFGYLLSWQKDKIGERCFITNKVVDRILSVMSTIITLVLVLVWLYIYLWQKGIVTFHL